VTTYTTAADIAAYLGVTFTPAQATAADQVAEAVTLYIDGYTGRTWQTASPVAAELDPVLPIPPSWLAPGGYAPPGGGYGIPGGWFFSRTPAGVVYLRQTPALMVSSVSLRTAYPHAVETVLDPSQYELVDAPHGVVTVAGVSWAAGLLAVVGYTFTATVPADIELAATMMGAAEMARQIAVQQASAVTEQHPELAGLGSIAVGRNDIAITRSTVTAATGGGAAPKSDFLGVGSAAKAILDGYRRVVLA
jgi:hypothetical protein